MPDKVHVIDKAQDQARRWAELVGRIAQAQDRQAFAELFAHFAPRLKAHLMKSGVAAPQAEDLAQEAMITLWRKAALFRVEDGGVATWLFTIARNLRIDAIRRGRRGSDGHVSDVEARFIPDDSPSAQARVETTQAQARIREAIAALPAEQMRVVELSFFEDKAHPDIARALGVPLGTVKSRLRLAMARLRRIMEPDR